MAGPEAVILENLQSFIAFARNRTGDPALAEDLVQDSLIKALIANRKPQSDEDTVKWFYRILRRTIIDLYRRTDVRKRALERMGSDLPEQPEPADHRLICQCFRRLLPQLPEGYREVIERIDLDGVDPGQLAADLAVTRNSLNVRLHRARRALRERLEQNCRACSKHGCLDCTCDQSDSEEPCGSHARD